MLIGILFFIYALLKTKKKHKALRHYEEIRDKLALREPEPEEEIEEEDYSSGIGISLGNIIGGFIVLLVGVMILPEIVNELNSATMAANVTGSMETTLGLTTLFFSLAIAVVAIIMLTTSFRRTGLI